MTATTRERRGFSSSSSLSEVVELAQRLADGGACHERGTLALEFQAGLEGRGVLGACRGEGAGEGEGFGLEQGALLAEIVDGRVMFAEVGRDRAFGVVMVILVGLEEGEHRELVLEVGDHDRMDGAGAGLGRRQVVRGSSACSEREHQGDAA